MTRRYPMRPRTTTMILGALFFGICALVLFWLALSGDRGLIIQRVIHLGPTGARVVHGVLCAGSLAFAVVAGVALFAYRGHQRVVVDDAGITRPGPLWRPSASRTIAFADVTEIREQKVRGEHFVTLIAPGRKLWIAKSHLPDGAFEEIVAFARERVAHRS